MNNNVNEDNLNVLKKIEKKLNISQKKLANNLRFRLGKLNYCLKELKKENIL